MTLPDVITLHNGEKAGCTFSRNEMDARVEKLRGLMAAEQIDAILFTSYHNINYYSDFLYCSFGRSYGLVVTHDDHTTISANIDGGQPWRRSYSDNVTYTDWQRDNFYRAVKKLVREGATVGIEFDHVTVQNREKLEAALPGCRLVDVSAATMRLRMIKSEEEIRHITALAAIADAGGSACAEAASVGTPEHEVALHATGVWCGR